MGGCKSEQKNFFLLKLGNAAVVAGKDRVDRLEVHAFTRGAFLLVVVVNAHHAAEHEAEEEAGEDAGGAGQEGEVHHRLVRRILHHKIEHRHHQLFKNVKGRDWGMNDVKDKGVSHR